MIAPHSLTRLGFSLAAVLIFSATSAHADPANSRAARLTYAQGTVTVNQPGNAESVPAQPNLPLLSGVQLATGNDGQAEVEFEDGSVVRLTPNSVLSLDNLAIAADGVFITDLSLLQGLAYCELRATPQYRYSLNAGGDILSPVENTTVRVNLDQPPAIFSVFDGTAQVEHQNAPNGEFAAAGYQTQVRAGESLRADPSDANRYFLTQQIADDSWDQWNEDRDQIAASEAANSTAVRNDYAGAEGYGWSDLDENGTWYQVPGQGEIWQPSIAADDPGFDPYGYGAWVWYPNAGYVWASGYAWGWTPYRCGNWSYFSGFGWGWAPGAGCGGLGWGFGGGGRPVNIVVGPTGYRPIRIPVSGTPHPRPIMPIRTTTPWTRSEPTGTVRGPRQIAGVTANPVRREERGPEPGSGAPRSSLNRDFPIDRSNKAPVLGLASTSPTAVHTTSGARSPTPVSRPSNSQPSVPAPGQPETYYGRYPAAGQPAPASTGSRQVQGGNSGTSSQPTRPSGQAAPVQTPSAPYSPAGRQTEQNAPVQRPASPQPPPSNQRNAPQPTDASAPAGRQTEQNAPVQRPASPQPPPSYQRSSPQPTDHSTPPPSNQRNAPQPTDRSAPGGRPVERSSPPPTERSAPPPQPSRPSSSSPPPAPESHPAPASPPPAASHPTTTTPTPPRSSPN